MKGTSEIHVSGTSFATAIARCAGEQERAGRHEHAATFYIGVGRKSGAEWTFSFRGDRGGFVANRRTYFLPILRTLNIYGR